MDMLVSTEWLAANLDAVRVLDASAHLPAAGRDPAAEFKAGHIPGAGFLGLLTLKDGSSDVPAALPRSDQFAERMAALGISSGDRIVLYDDSALCSSARAWFIFRMFGWDNVALLDGGLAKWRAENRALEVGSGTVQSADCPEPDRDTSRVRFKPDMLANCRTRDVQVVDARDAARFTGQSADTVHGLEGGHIPGAKHLFFRSLLRDDGCFKPREELRSLFDEAGIDLARPLVASCGSGITASVVIFAAELLGMKDAALYDGSWSEWGADPDTPKETGPAR